MSRDPATAPPRRFGFIDWVLRAVAVGYPLALLAVVLAFRLIGEKYWVTAATLYLPRIGFALPLPVLTLAILWRGPRRLLVSQLVAGVLVLFPLMGLRLPGTASASPGAFRLRLLTFNVATGSYGTDAILAELRASDADVILLQETDRNMYDQVRAGLPGYSHQVSGQFWLASRFPIAELHEPPKILHRGVARSPRFVRFVVTTPAGPIRIYSVHIISPRDALDELRGDGLRTELRTGRLLRGIAANTVVDNTSLRLDQLRAITTDAAQSGDPVIIAGDTNLPTLSWAVSHWLGDYRDGFADVGSGFGYTFPAPRHPWMRIDRIFARAPFRFLNFDVLRTRASDHYAVTAELELPH